ncbi:MAG: hypothetical protein EXR79_12380 [Myxococcales bacterium]|nr:hypothetical protein [Myxococcales bacterium]
MRAASTVLCLLTAATAPVDFAFAAPSRSATTPLHSPLGWSAVAPSAWMARHDRPVDVGSGQWSEEVRLLRAEAPGRQVEVARVEFFARPPGAALDAWVTQQWAFLRANGGRDVSMRLGPTGEAAVQLDVPGSPQGPPQRHMFVALGPWFVHAVSIDARDAVANAGLGEFAGSLTAKQPARTPPRNAR